MPGANVVSRPPFLLDACCVLCSPAFHVDVIFSESQLCLSVTSTRFMQFCSTQTAEYTFHVVLFNTKCRVSSSCSFTRHRVPGTTFYSWVDYKARPMKKKTQCLRVERRCRESLKRKEETSIWKDKEIKKVIIRFINEKENTAKTVWAYKNFRSHSTSRLLHRRWYSSPEICFFFPVTHSTNSVYLSVYTREP